MKMAFKMNFFIFSVVIFLYFYYRSFLFLFFFTFAFFLMHMLKHLFHLLSSFVYHCIHNKYYMVVAFVS